MDLDVIIEGGIVHDGTGGTATRADVGVRGDRVEAIGDLRAAGAGFRLDARGLVVAPGFIDTHTHSDLVWGLGDEHRDVAAGTVRQGVTTEIAGNCGFSCFPCLPDRRAALDRHVGTVLGGGGGAAFPDLAAYAGAASGGRLFANLASLIGHGSLRAGVLGFENRPPRDDEMTAMRSLLEASFEQGALGLSTGLVYLPGVYARTEELVGLAGAVAAYGRPYISHIRGEGDSVAGSVREAIRIGREAGLPTHISHHKVAGRRNWGRTEETLGMIAAARAEGQDVSVDVYPYTAGSTLLQAVLPPWAQEGGVDAILDRLRDGQARDRIGRDLVEGLPGWDSHVDAAGWAGIVISACPGRPELEGRSVPEMASDLGPPEVDAVLDLLLEQRCRVLMIVHSMHEADVSRVLASEMAMIGSDGIPVPGKPHPRWAGTFARVLGRYSRERRLFDLAAAIHKMTGMPADRFGLRGRGVVARGAFADLVVLDPDAVIDRATYDDPLLPPLGVRDVLVNGVLAVRDGELTDARAGRFLRA
ncbi:MAG TPA: D-aminoacylase [Candidatus Dormibacteraeota bacterium]